MVIINLLPHIYNRFYRFETPTEPSEIEAEKLLAKIIENNVYYDVTKVEIHGMGDIQDRKIKDKVRDHMLKRYDICRNLRIKDKKSNRIINTVPASIILEKAKMNISKKKLAFVYSVTNKDFDIDYDILEQICNIYIYDYDKSGILLRFIDQIKSEGDALSEEDFGGGGKYKKRRKSKKHKSKRRKSKRRKSKRRKTRRNKR